MHTMSTDREKDLLTIPEAAEFLRLKISTIRAWLLNRRLPFVKLGGRVFLRERNLREYVDSCVVPAKLRNGEK